jgi:hypothetical protein
MSLEPFLRRELLASVRRGTAFSERRGAVVVLTAVIVGCFLVWDCWGLDRSSVTGSAKFGLAVFGLMVAAQITVVIGGGFVQVAPRIASERDRKSLDVLLTTHYSSAEIVLGALAASLLRYVNSLAATLPVVVLMVVIGGIDPCLVMAAGAGLSATWYAVAAISIAASVVARTEVRARSLASAIGMGWLGMPYVFVVIRPVIWPGCPRFVTSAALTILGSGPIGVFANLLGIATFGSPFVAILRMTAWELIGGTVVVAWSIWRLRSASRAAFDAEQQTARRRVLRMVRAAGRRWPRPPCGDDPVLWYAMHSERPAKAAWVVGQVINLGWIGFLVFATSWFAGPAFHELVSQGYGAWSGRIEFPDPSPLTRFLINSMNLGISLSSIPGQARLEFNIALRQFSAVLASPFALGMVIAASKSISMERRCDTWLGLIATPLTGWEILRAKMLGAVWYARGYIVTMIALWTIGLLAGALHPLGFLAGLTELAALTAFCTALGVSMSLWELDQLAVRNPRIWPVHTLTSIVGMLLLILGPILYTMSSLLSYEDVQFAFRTGTFLPWSEWSGWSMLRVRVVVFAWLFTTSSLAVGALLLIRVLSQGFDAAIGRPTRNDGRDRSDP